MRGLGDIKFKPPQRLACRSLTRGLCESHGHESRCSTSTATAAPAAPAAPAAGSESGSGGGDS